MTVQRHDVVNCKEDNCFPCKLETFNISSAALPTRKRHINEKSDFVRDFDIDKAAYKRLRADGLQPKRVLGASILEKHAVSKWEIEQCPGQNFRGDEKVGRAHDELQTAIAKSNGKPVEV